MIEVSVVMTVYNADRFLNESIDSILNQTFTNFEFIIVNDGSTDKSLELIKSYKDERIKIINQINRGVSRAANTAINIAKGKYIARFDADDISLKSRLEKQVEFLNNHTEYNTIGSNACIIDLNGEYLHTSDLFTDWEDLQKCAPNYPIFNSSSMFRKDDFIKFGGYNLDFCDGNYAEDKILFNQLAKYGKIANLKDILIKYRYSPLSLSNLDVKSIKLLKEKLTEYLKSNKKDAEPLKRMLQVKTNIKFHNYYLKVGSIHITNGNKIKALKKLFFSLKYCLFSLQAYLKIFACFIPHSLYKKLKERKLKR